MLAWVVIDRTYSRQFPPISSSPRTLCLCDEFFDPFPPTSVVPTTYALLLATAPPQPLCNQSVTHSFYLDEGIPPSGAALTTAILSNAYPMFPIFTFLHSPKTQLFYFQGIPHSASKSQPPGGEGDTSAIRKFLQFSSRFSPVKAGNSLRSTARQSRVTSALFLEIQPGQSGQLSPLHGTPVTSHQSPSSDSGEPK